MTAAPQPAMMPLRVTRADKIANGIHLFELRDAAGAELPPFTAGAHIAIRAPNGLLRKYSLCNDPAERDRYVIAVKREAEGRGGSHSLIDDVSVGSELCRLMTVTSSAGPSQQARSTSRIGHWASSLTSSKR